MTLDPSIQAGQVKGTTRVQFEIERHLSSHVAGFLPLTGIKGVFNLSLPNHPCLTHRTLSRYHLVLDRRPPSTAEQIELSYPCLTTLDMSHTRVRDASSSCLWPFHHGRRLQVRSGVAGFCLTG